MISRRCWIALALFLVPLPAWSATPLDGTWKVVPGSYQASVRLDFSVRHGIYQCNLACGTQGSGRYGVPADGIFHAVAGIVDFDQLAVRVVDPRTLRIRYRKHGMLVRVASYTLEPDGRHADVLTTEHRSGLNTSMHSRLTRISSGPPGSHALSGAWRLTTAEDGISSWTYIIHTRGRVLTLKDSTGPEFRATVGGPPATVHGHIPGETVSVRRVGPRAWRETFRKHDDCLGTMTITIDATGERADVVKTQSDDTVIQRWSMARQAPRNP